VQSKRDPAATREKFRDKKRQKVFLCRIVLDEKEARKKSSLPFFALRLRTLVGIELTRSNNCFFFFLSKVAEIFAGKKVRVESIRGGAKMNFHFKLLATLRFSRLMSRLQKCIFSSSSFRGKNMVSNISIFPYFFKAVFCSTAFKRICLSFLALSCLLFI
jgi:hypothetical protein